MSGLIHLQKDFQDYLLTPGTAPGLERHIVDTAYASAQLRLGIYAEAYRLRLEEALCNDFEALHGLLGDEQFHTLCLFYIDAHPSRHFSLRYFGQHMAAFLAQTEPYAGNPVLAELAEFEWALIDAFDAWDSTVITVEEMGRLAPDVWPMLCFEWHASVQRLELAWNVQRLWSALKEDTAPETPQRSDAAQPWLIWRRELATYFRSLTAHEAWALDTVRAGENFSTLCAGLCAWVAEDQAAATAAGLLHRWVSDGLISRILLSDKTTYSETPA
ncbi:MAG: DNA-binding domain-containing protein [Gammaproteobacteria bacterium]